jgi:hypothetical protein
MENQAPTKEIALAPTTRKTKTKAASKTNKSRRGTTAPTATSSSGASAKRNGRRRQPNTGTGTRANVASVKTGSGATATLTCPECGRTFTRAAALGAHRRQAHGVIGTSASSRANGSRRKRSPSKTASTTTGRQQRAVTVDHDALLKALFPNGIPANKGMIRSVNSWLEEADRLARG